MFRIKVTRSTLTPFHHCRDLIVIKQVPTITAALLWERASDAYWRAAILYDTCELPPEMRPK